MREVKLPTLHCYRCIYEWTPVRSPVRICPRCKSKLWDMPKIRPVKLGSGLGIDEVLGPHLAEIRNLERKHGVRRLRVFGSVRRREATPKSDVDLLVQWKRPNRISLLDKAELLIDLEAVLHRKVDLVSEGALDWAIRPQVEAEAVPL
jgi:predicted nucleotidyltransferase